MRRVVEGLPVSVQVRLARRAKATGLDPNLLLVRFALERFLYRLSKSPHADRFVLKGALLMLVWLGETIRPTRDGDLLGFGDLSARALTQILGEVCGVGVEPDGVEFAPASIRVVPIRPENAYGGMRARLHGRLGKARLRVQLDVGERTLIGPRRVRSGCSAAGRIPRARHGRITPQPIVRRYMAARRAMEGGQVKQATEQALVAVP